MKVLKNSDQTSKEVILDQLNESRPLPMGREEFEVWANRLIAGALLPTSHLPQERPSDTDVSEEIKIHIESQKYVLANMLMHLGPTESHKPDAYFIHSLRKFAVNQVADTVRKELHEAAKARTAAEEAKQKDE